MCTSSDNLKLCSCKAKSSHQLQNYWALFRRNKNKNIMLVGEVMINYVYSKAQYKEDYSILEYLINEDGVFDIPMTFKNKDLLLLVFNNHQDTKRSTYEFQSTKEQWKKSDKGEFYLDGFCDEIQFGKVKK